MQNGGRGFSLNDTPEISNFRQALPQFLAVSVKNILLFGNYFIIYLFFMYLKLFCLFPQKNA